MHRYDRIIFNGSIGTLPLSLCDITGLTSLHVTDNSGNPLVICSPDCLTTVSDRFIPVAACPTPQDVAICGVIAATNVASISTHTMWSCTTDGFTSTDPCSASWSGVTCTNSNIVHIDLNAIGLTGIVIIRD